MSSLLASGHSDVELTKALWIRCPTDRTSLEQFGDTLFAIPKPLTQDHARMRIKDRCRTGRIERTSVDEEGDPQIGSSTQHVVLDFLDTRHITIRAQHNNRKLTQDYKKRLL